MAISQKPVGQQAGLGEFGVWCVRLPRPLRGLAMTNLGAAAMITTVCAGRDASLPAQQLVKKVPSGFFDKLLSELQNHFLQHDFAILPLRRVIERERKP